MKRLLFLLWGMAVTFCVLWASFSAYCGMQNTCMQSNLLISEVCDPADNYKGRFVEIFNPGTDTVDFSIETWYLARQANGTTWGDLQLTGMIAPGGCHVVANNAANFLGIYGFDPNQAGGIISGNGNDGYFLFYGGDHSSGILADSYGVVDEDGTGTAWEYLDAKAVRIGNIAVANSVWTASEWHISSNAAIAQTTPSFHAQWVSWNGSVSENWDDPLNWTFPGSLSFFPDASASAVLAPGLPDYPTLTDTVVIHNINLSCDSLNNSSLLNSEKMFVAGNAQVSLFLTGGINARKDDPDAVYHFVASPVEWSIAGNVFPLSAYIRTWDEASQMWVNLIAADTLTSGTGYSAYLAGGSDYIDFTGQFCNEAVETSLSFTQGGPGNIIYEGYNLVGNPYPCGLDWDQGSWVKTGIDAAIAIWSWENGGYIYWNGTVGDITDGVIPVGQGFFVKAGVASPQLTIPLDARVHHGSGVYDTGEVPDLLKLTVAGGKSYRDHTYIHFRNNASTGYDLEYDALKLDGLLYAPQVCCRDEEGNELAIHTLPVEAGDMSVEVLFYTGYDGNFSFQASGIENFTPETGIFLEDIKTGDLVDLKEQAQYEFAYLTGDDPLRFYVHFSGLTGFIEDAPVPGVYRSGSEWVFRPECPDALLEIFDMSGRMLYSEYCGKRELRLPANRVTGICIARFTCGSDEPISFIIYN
ncbi:MAG: hypothetical protein KKA81_05840 [Bacteroidetes bacterium]|nr:hypothetical protein [Bacteroidota bacterium]